MKLASPITYGSVCSGIEAASVAWHPLGWRAVWLAEIEAFPSAVLAHHYPDVPNLGDMTKLAALVLAGEIEAPDVLVGGTPCQAFSVAGLRAGLTDQRGQLTLRFMELADAIDHVRQLAGKPPCIIVWENVPGVLSDKTNAFGCFLGGLAGEDEELQPPGKKWSNAGCVFGSKRAIAWRVLDAQYFRVAQRRRRVFLVSSAREGFDPTAILFEFDGLRRDSAPSRDPGQDVAGTISARTSGGGGLGTDFECAGGLQPVAVNRLVAFGEYSTDGAASTCQARDYKGATDLVVEAYGFQPRIARNGRGDMGDVVSALTAQAGETGKGDAAPCVALAFEPRYYLRDNKTGGAPSATVQLSATNAAKAGDAAPCVAYAPTGMKQASYIRSGWAVRRLTPCEGERLQGFPDFYTQIPYKKKPAADGPRYKSLGNSMAVPCMAFLGRRINTYFQGNA